MNDDFSPVQPLDRQGTTSTLACPSPSIRTPSQVVTTNRQPHSQSTPEFTATGTFDGTSSKLVVDDDSDSDSDTDADIPVILLPRAPSLPLDQHLNSLVATVPHTSWIPSSEHSNPFAATISQHTSQGSSTVLSRYGSTMHLPVPSGIITPSPCPSPAADDHRPLPSLVPMGSAGNMLLASATTLYSPPSAGASSTASHSAYKYGASLAQHPISLYNHEFANESDDLHTLDPNETKNRNHGISWVGALDLGGLILLIMSCIMLFAGYPIYAHYTTHGYFIERTTGRPGGTNQTGQIPNLPLRELVDQDTPSSAYTWRNSEGQQFNLVFSDEFNEEGRTFWRGDDVSASVVSELVLSVMG